MIHTFYFIKHCDCGDIIFFIIYFLLNCSYQRPSLIMHVMLPIPNLPGIKIYINVTPKYNIHYSYSTITFIEPI